MSSATASDDEEPLAKCLKTDQPEEYDEADKPSILCLKEDILVKIIQLLSVKEQIGFERVCKLCQSAVKMFLKSVKTLDLNDCLPSDPRWQYRFGGIGVLLSVISRLGSHLTSLSIPGGPRGRFGQPELLALSRDCPQLKHLSFELVSGSLSAMEKLPNQLNQLNSLKLSIPKHPENHRSNLFWFDRRIGLILSSMPNLKHLGIECLRDDFSQLEGNFLASLPSSIDSVSFSHNAFSYLHRNNDEQLANFLRLHQGLKHFEMNSVLYAHPTVPTVLAQYCTGLESLKITGCQLLSFNHRSSTAFVKAFQSLTQLEHVDVSLYCYFTDFDLKSLRENCPNVRVLRMGHQHTDAWLPSEQEKALLLSLDGLNHLEELKQLKLVSLDCYQIIITAEIVSALCQGSGAKVEDFHFCTNREPNGWRKFTEAGMCDFVEATSDHSRTHFFRVEVDRVGRRVWLKKGSTHPLAIHMEKIHP